LGTSPEGGGYREEKAQLGLQAQQLERMRKADVEDTEDILLRISSIGSINFRARQPSRRMRCGRSSIALT